MPRAYEPGPLAQAIRDLESNKKLSDKEIRRTVRIATGLDARLVKGLMEEQNPLTEKTVDIVCCNYLRVHPWQVYGDWYFGDRVEKYMLTLDQQYGTSISKYCDHDWETVLPSQLPELSEAPLVRRMLIDGLVSIVHCAKCDQYSHSLEKPLEAAG